MQPMRLLFDLDGTLMDTAPDLHATLNHCLIDAGRDTVSLESVKHMVGQGARVLVERGLQATGDLLHGQEFEDLIDLFFSYYGDHLSDHSLIYEGVLTALDTLDQAGCHMGICTNKPFQFADTIVKDFALDPYFPILTGGDSFDVRKPDPQHILKTLDMLDLKTGPAVMIGDSNNDIDAAKAAGVHSIAVSFGYSDVPASELGADYLIDQFDELVPVLEKISEKVA